MKYRNLPISIRFTTTLADFLLGTHHTIKNPAIPPVLAYNKLDELGACDERIQRLQTILGVGPRLAETVVAFLDDPRRFQNSKQVGCYAGLTPKQYQSGQTEHQGKISGQGNKLLRNLLVEICWVSLRYNPWARDAYKRLLRGSKSRKKIAITALARKLVVRCWVMLRYERDWREDIRKNVA